MSTDHIIVTRRRPLLVRFWLSYKAWRKYLPVIPALKAAFIIAFCK